MYHAAILVSSAIALLNVLTFRKIIYFKILSSLVTCASFLQMLATFLAEFGFPILFVARGAVSLQAWLAEHFFQYLKLISGNQSPYNLRF